MAVLGDHDSVGEGADPGPRPPVDQAVGVERRGPALGVGVEGAGGELPAVVAVVQQDPRILGEKVDRGDASDPTDPAPLFGVPPQVHRSAAADLASGGVQGEQRVPVSPVVVDGEEEDDGAAVRGDVGGHL